MGFRTTNVFDAAGQRVALVNARNARWTFVYDVAGRHVNEIDPLSRVTTYGYDPAGRPVLKVDARGVAVTNSYDAAGQLAVERFPDAVHTFTYDAAGQRTLMFDLTGRYTTTYDPAGRVTRVENPHSKTITYAYDAAGQRTAMIESDGGTFTYDHDPAGRNTLVVNPQAERTTLIYDPAGQKTASLLANGSRASYAYDPAGRNTLVHNLNSSNATLSRFDYTFDAAGNKIQVVEANGDVVTWSYDNTYQLKRERRSGTNGYDTTYTYDTVGNRLLKIDGAERVTYAYDLANQIQTSIDNAGVTTFTHDAAGNRTAKQSPSDLTTYQWNGDGRLTSVSAPGVLATYTYNAARQRVKVDDGAGAKAFLYDFAKLLTEYASSGGAMIARYTNTLEDAYGELVSQFRTSGGISSYFAFDGLGSTVGLYDQSQVQTDAWLYKAFGAVLLRTGATVNPFTFVGKFGYYEDPAIDFYYLNDRYYSSLDGRFVSEDSLGFQSDDINLFAYVRLNPVNGIDPSGLFQAPAGCVKIAIIDPAFGGPAFVKKPPQGGYNVANIRDCFDSCPKCNTPDPCASCCDWCHHTINRVRAQSWRNCLSRCRPGAVNRHAGEEECDSL